LMSVKLKEQIVSFAKGYLIIVSLLG